MELPLLPDILVRVTYDIQVKEGLEVSTDNRLHLENRPPDILVKESLSLLLPPDILVKEELPFLPDIQVRWTLDILVIDGPGMYPFSK